MSTKESCKMLTTKLANISSQLGHIEKRGHNDAHGYDFVQASDVASAVRKLFSENGVVFLPSMIEYECQEVQTARSRAYHFIIKMNMCFIDSESGERIDLPWIGEALDWSDKAVNKVATSATKYFLLTMFLVPTGADPDADGIEPTGPALFPKQGHDDDEKPASVKLAVLQDEARSAGIPWDGLVKFMEESGTHPDSMSDAEADTWIEWTRKKGKEGKK